MFIAALFTIAKIWKKPNCPTTEEWIQKIWQMYTTEYCSAIKQNESLPLVTTWMDLEGMMLSEISQTEIDKYMISLICGILKKQKSQTKIQRVDWWLPKVRSVEWMKWVKGVKRYKLSAIKLSHQNVMYSMALQLIILYCILESFQGRRS